MYRFLLLAIALFIVTAGLIFVCFRFIPAGFLLNLAFTAISAVGFTLSGMSLNEFKNVKRKKYSDSGSER